MRLTIQHSQNDEALQHDQLEISPEKHIHACLYALIAQIAQEKKIVDIHRGNDTGVQYLAATAEQVFAIDETSSSTPSGQQVRRLSNIEHISNFNAAFPLDDHQIDGVIGLFAIDEVEYLRRVLPEFQRILAEDSFIGLAIASERSPIPLLKGGQQHRSQMQNILRRLGHRYSNVNIWQPVFTVERQVALSVDAGPLSTVSVDLIAWPVGEQRLPDQSFIVIASDEPLPDIDASFALPDVLIADETGEIGEQKESPFMPQRDIAALANGHTLERARVTTADYYRVAREVELLRKEQRALRAASLQLANTLAHSPHGNSTLADVYSEGKTSMKEASARKVGAKSNALIDQQEMLTLLQRARQAIVAADRDAEKQSMMMMRALTAVEQQIYSARDDITRVASMLISSRSWRLGNGLGNVFAVFRSGVPYDATYEIKKDIQSLRTLPRLMPADAQRWIHDCIMLFSSLQFHIEEVTRSKRFLFGRFVMRFFSRMLFRAMLPGAETALSPLLDTTLHQLFNTQSNLVNRAMLSQNGQESQQVRIISPTGHTKSVDIVVCVHNALAVVRECLDSVMLHTEKPYHLIIVDDGSQPETQQYLKEFAQKHRAQLLRNATAQGYTFAANAGLRASIADYVVLLNSDTIVTPTWLDRMVQCGESGEHIGIVGPLSNTASWQSVPHIEHQGDWAENRLPEESTVEEIGRMVAAISPQAYPQIAFLNGFCYMIKREVIDTIGLFDEEHFGRGYGEENDYSIRARENGFTLAVADDVYVFHHQSQSYSHEKRKMLADKAMEQLLRKHAKASIDAGVKQCREDLSMLGIRLRVEEQLKWNLEAKATAELFKGRRLAFLLPVESPGGGANVVIQEARIMREMLDMDVSIINLVRHQAGFQRSYPNVSIPIIWIDIPKRLETAAAEFDAVIATAHHSVEWLAFLPKHIVKGYYIQDFEPYFYPKKSKEYNDAFHSYSRFPDMRLITKSQWNHNEVLRQTGKDSAIVGPSADTQLFAPRPVSTRWPQRPLNILAMIRPGSAYRNPEMTLRVLQAMRNKHGASIAVTIFGCSPDNPQLPSFVFEQGWTIAGIVTREEIAGILPNMDIFVDFSTHQAMGLSALEAMSCGVATIVPQIGGAIEFAYDHINALVVDALNEQECVSTLDNLILDHELRAKIQRRAISDAVTYSPIGPSIAILKTMLGQQ